MKIHELFEKDIYRNISGVVKVEQTNAEVVFAELDEFVFTRELRGHFHNFYSAYNKSLDGKTDKMGVWISGFFGSGKSHLLKILCYLLENKDVETLKAIEFFKEKMKDDPLLYNDMKRATNYTTDALLFNIESKSTTHHKTSKTAIVDVFVKVLNDRLGYCGDVLWLAEIERTLDEDGRYEAFKKAYAEIDGETWEEGRSKAYFIRDTFIEAITKASHGMSQESAALLFDNAEKTYSHSCERFAQLVKKYLDKKGRQHRIVFLVDEMGQYIGDNSDLMLNLQTVTEDLGIHCLGRAWLVVTSQEAIDAITKHRFKDQDFSKIQGRFDIRLNLSSSNTDEVIKKRLLEKKHPSKEKLAEHYKEQRASLNNLISFSSQTSGMKSFQDEGEFVESYPFIPYQFNLLQKVFENIRKFSHAGKHLAEGERSMLNAFHAALIETGKYDEGMLVPFHTFFNTVESFIDSSIKRIFDKSKAETNLEDFYSILPCYEKNPPYPGKETITGNLTLYKDVRAHKDAPSFLEHFTVKGDELKTLKAHAQPVREFFSGAQKGLFDRALHVSQLYEQNRFSLEGDDTINHCVRELEEIISDPSPYGKIKNIPEYESGFNERFKALLNDEKEKVKKSIEKDMAHVSEKARNELGSENFLNQEMKQFIALLEKVENAVDFNVLAVKEQSAQHRDKLVDKINEETKKRKPETKEREDIPLSSIKVTGVPKKLETEGDVDAYTKTLGDAMKSAIRTNKIIVVEE